MFVSIDSARHGHWKTLLAFLAASTLVVARDDQAPFQYPEPAWANPSDPSSSLIFNSINSLLQQWPNTRYRNGHSVALATIPPGTTVYHGRTDSIVPTTPEWLGFDPDHSYIFCFGKCHLMTFVATRELRVAYFDGSSANKMPSGTLDTQDIVTHGGLHDARPTWDEVGRLADLCDWGKKYNLDGFVRMEPIFEFMACDFSAGLHLVSAPKIVPPEKIKMDLPGDIPISEPKKPQGWKGRLRTVPSLSFETLHAGSKHNFAPGETRVKLDYSKVFNFYDPAITSLVQARKNQTRERYRAGDLSKADAKGAQERIADMFARPGKGSGIDWGSITQVVVDRYSDRLQLIKHLLEEPGSRNVTEQASQIRSQALIVLTPYMLAEVIPSSTSGTRSWVAPIAQQCASTLTSWAPVDILEPEEWVIKHAIEGVLHEICHVISDIWVDAFGVEELDVSEKSRLIQKWKHDINGLISWLDWAVWFTCYPACGPEEMCYIPTWPFIQGGIGTYPPDPYGNAPRCIRAVDPYESYLDL